MPESVKKAVEIKTPTTKKTIEKKKVVTKKPVEKTSTETKTTGDVKPKLTQGQKLLKAMTAQKAAKKALMKGVASTHVSFDDEGNENVETVIQKTAPVVVPKKTNKNRPAMKKPEKRKAEDDGNKEEKEKDESTEKEKTDAGKVENKKPPKRAKKVKKSKVEIEAEKKDNKQEEALAYVRLFVNDRDSWKFKKVQQIWLLSNLYEIPEDEFDNVLEYLKDLQGSAREKTKKEAEEKIPQKKEIPVSNTLTGYSAVNTTNDDDDFDAEKLLAQATMAPPTTAATAATAEEEDEEDETLEIKRAKLIVSVLQ